jgi:hypothetical protein
MPALSTIFLWLSGHEDFSEQYARATQVRAEHLASEILDIGDEVARMVQRTESGNEYVDRGMIDAARLRIDSRKWLLAKQHPRVYGEAMLHRHTGTERIIPTLPRTFDSILHRLSSETLDELQRVLRVEMAAALPAPSAIGGTDPDPASVPGAAERRPYTLAKSNSPVN